MKMRAILSSIGAVAVAVMIQSCVGSSKSGQQTSFVDDMPVIASRIAIGGDSMIVVDMTSISSPIIVKASDLADDLQMVKLESTDDALVKPGFTWVTDKRIIVYSWETGVKQFDRTSGKYLGNVGSKGQGPGEYAIAPKDIAVDENTGKIYLLDEKKIMTYDTNGQYIGDIPLAYTARKGFMTMDGDNGNITVMAMPFKDLDEPVVVWVQDTIGNVVSEIRREDLAVFPDYSNEVMAGVSGSGAPAYNIWHYNNDADTVYAYTGDALIPDFTVNFGDEIPLHLGNAFPRFITVEKVGGYKEENMPGTVTLQWQYPVIVDRTTLRGAPACLMLDPWGPVMLEDSWTWQRSPGYFAVTLEPGVIAEKIDQADVNSPLVLEKNLKAMKALRESIDDDDNCYVIVGRMKR